MLLVKCLARENVQWWADKLNLDLCVLSILRFRFAQRIFHCIYAIIAKACNLNICANLCRLWGEALADVCLEFIFHCFAWKCDFVPNFWIGNGKLESIDRMTVFFVQWPSNRFVKFFNRCLGLLGYMSHY